MNHANAMIQAYPGDINSDRELLARCIRDCFDCAQTCTACADACLSETPIEPLAKCIRTNLDCADICDTTGRIVSRHTGYDASVTRTILQACTQACESCGGVCEDHAGKHGHCRICAEMCRRCQQTCQDLLNSL